MQPRTLCEAIFPRVNIWREVAVVVAFSFITAICAQITIPLWPVPITGQTFAVLLSGAVLGSRRGAMSQLSYLAIGATGLPFWFAPGGTLGIASLLGPTGGYLVGFVAAAFVVGLLAERGWDRSFWKAVLAMVAGSAVIYLFGLPWLANFVPANAVLSAGLYPFIPGDLLKLIVAAAALPSAWMVLRRFRL